MKSPDDEYSDGLEAELRQFSLALQQANTAYLTVKVENTVQVAELESLRKENAALLVTIEAKDAALKLTEFGDTGFDTRGEAQNYCPECGNLKRQAHTVSCPVAQALTLSPSTELLEARDRKRDAKLIAYIAKDFFDETDEQLLAIAHMRESGEWVPELGD